ncbi:MAG: outer membrane beta-barrel protein [Spirochaetales bacterium]|nr:outer membrane beta-barrel protein [Spirochaetales bacterium]
MKKNLLVLLVLIAGADIVSADVGFGIKNSIGLSSFTGSDWKDVLYWNDADNKTGISYSAGFFIDFSGDYFGFQIDILYSSITAGVKAKDSEWSGYEWIEWRENLIEVPLYLKLGFPVGQKGKVVFMGGPNILYTIGSITETYDDGYGYVFPWDELYDFPLKFGIAVGIGYENRHFRTALIYKKTITEAVADYNRHNQNFGMEIGYRF